MSITNINSSYSNAKWTTGQTYSVNDILWTSVNGKMYPMVCLTNHVAGTLANDIQSGYWQAGTPEKNYIINSAMTVAQRGSIAAVNNTFTYGGCDRWAVAPFMTTASGTITQSSLTAASSGFGQVLSSATATGSGTVQFYTRLESAIVKPLNGKMITIQCSFYQDTGSTLTAQVQVAKANTQDNFGALTSLGAPSFSIPTGVLTKVQFELILGSTDASNGLEIRPFFNTGAFTSKNFAIADVALNEGPAPISFQTNSSNYQAELAACQRYTRVYNNSNSSLDTRVQGSSVWAASLMFPTMRVSPTIDVTLLGTYKNTSGGPGTNQWQFINISSGGSVTWGTAPTTLAQTSQSIEHSFIFQNSGVTPSEAVTGQMYTLTLGSGSQFVLSAEL
jgi:hypothetical protein